MNTTMGVMFLIIGAIAAIALIIYIAFSIFHSPFHYPYFTYYFDVSGKRQPQIEDLIDRFLITRKFGSIQRHYEEIQCWKEECQEIINESILTNYRYEQYLNCLDDECAFQFYLTRQQTRYQQRNYEKKPYKVTQIADRFDCSYEYLLERNKQLDAINYECTIREYHSQNQRRLLTKDLRRKIILRDNYTCQVCGKFMPDEVGLHVDHIIPVSKGGKSILSNLQVLCSKCNGRKSNK